MFDVHSMSNQPKQDALTRQQVQSSGAISIDLVQKLQLTVKWLEKGDTSSSSQTFWAVMEDLQKFKEVLDKVMDKAGEKGIVVRVFLEKIKEYNQRLQTLLKDGEVAAFMDVLQYELLPLLAGWDGVKNRLMDYLDDVP